jgi:hypothetical protein
MHRESLNFKRIAWYDEMLAQNSHPLDNTELSLRVGILWQQIRKAS